MTQVTLSEAQQRLPDLLTAAAAGEEVVITKAKQGNFRLVLISAGATRPRPPVTGVPQAGRLRGQLIVPDDFDAPLDELRESRE